MNRIGDIAVKEESPSPQKDGLNHDLNGKPPSVYLGGHDPFRELERGFQTHRQNEMLA
ncbi:hypothetical protein [Parasphingorhabdus sp.]|uniref:hypothetical protein n=1 Tax=Parasphingorhabdus sp. TaxID=2709688 RepID=UPI0013734B08